MFCDLIKILNGKWHLERHVKEFNISMKGTAEFVPLNELTLKYKESGVYAHKHNQYNFFQNYIFSMHCNKLLVIKNDSSILHEFELADSKSYPITLNHNHECERDIYSCQLTVQNDHCFRIFYCINGHNKNYTTTTAFQKITKI